MVPERIAVLACCALLAACASDAVPEPEPEFQEPGAFVAVDQGTGALTLLRTLDRLLLENGVIVLFATVYRAEPSTWEEAREISKGRVLPMRQEVTTVHSDVFAENPYRVVWFRTLTEEEEERVR